ncbi:DUF928 domain-containing protein [Fortiea sp. LEGE XX443]|uniref:DUF928 domain-containing protein n=1 Tax=Fortiea sp. LEGE XX443 TaxID=1828611 RepID=UPI00188115DC|nr:DUF928 domain-containing protein [Fortiea sp. LEGE XX443]MBE9006325.1 DUF928 domain-containing protein [Fortiea sp. LEGE XX443]
MIKKTLLLITLGLTLIPDLLLTTVTTIAAPTNSVSQLTIPRPKPRFAPRRRSLLRFKVPGIRGSRNLEAGAARGKCSPQDINGVLPPKPATIAANQIPVELTISDRPTFFVSVPRTSAKQAVFLLRDEAGEEIVDKTLPLTASSGIMSYTLPADFQGLEVGKKYRWRFSLLCDPTRGDRSGDPVASGWIERTELPATVAKKLETATNKQRILIYADNGYWHDTLKTLADLRAASPNDLTLVRDWDDLLRSVGLETISKQPLIQLSITTASSP